ncbi:MAG: hypothetical protein AAGH15_23310 [Myxococcota bacterium]
MTKLDTAGLRAFVGREWDLLDAKTRSERARRSIAEKTRMAVALYESVQATRPDWPDERTRREDLAHHQRLKALLARAPNVGHR